MGTGLPSRLRNLGIGRSGYRQEVEEEVKPAVLLFRGREPLSAMIRWQTRSVYSHAALLLDNGCVIEAISGRGVRLVPPIDLSAVDVFDVSGMSERQWGRAIQFARHQIGCGYDYWAIIRFISRNRMPYNHKWFCSELVFAAIAQAGVNLLERVEPWAVSPGLLAMSPLLIPRHEHG